MKKSNKKRLIVLVVLLVLILLGVYWFLSPTTFLQTVVPGEVTKISVFNGNSGNSFTIEDKAEIKQIVNNIQNIELERKGISIGYMGYGYALSFLDDKGREIKTFIVNSKDIIRKNPFFYYDENESIDYNFLVELEGKYSNKIK